jgi:structural maintenance of chromosome 2
VYS